MYYHKSGNIPFHVYCFVDSAFIRKPTNKTTNVFEPCIWFGLTSVPSQMWGCTLMLECGAIYRNVPPHALAFSTDAQPKWLPSDAQMWDCYGSSFSVLEYTYLRGLSAETKQHRGKYLFTAVPTDDSFSREPTQSKEFMFIRLENQRLTIQPTDRVLFRDKSFIRPEWPTTLKRQSETYTCEDDYE